jgi:large subunit ribosomal protein L6
MKKSFEKQIELPEKVEAKLEGNKLTIKGPAGEDSREFKLGKINFKIKDKKIILNYANTTKKEKKIINTTTAHIKNMIKGSQDQFIYELKIAASHFPMTVKVEGNKALIKNFLGEKVDRICSIPKGAEVKVDRGIITVKSHSKEIAGQTAANFETATRITKRDRRTFQDGIFMINKAGKEI